MTRAAIGAGLAVTLTGPPAVAQTPAGELVLPGDPQSRIDVRARLEALRLNLQNHPSATAVLRAWCQDHGLADDPQIRAVAARGADKPMRPEDQVALGVQPGEPVRYRRVQLVCGERVLSEADNWYRPGQLTAPMVETLDATDIPFGVVIAPIRFQRRTLSSRLMFQPTDQPEGPLVAPPHVLENRALLLTPDGEPISLVVETYTSQVLAGRLRPRTAQAAAD